MPSVDPVAPVSGVDAAAVEVSGIGAEDDDGGRAGSGGGAAELDAVERPQSSAAQPRPW